MIELVKAGGWPMIPLLLLSFVALAIIVVLFPLALFGVLGLAAVVLVHEVAEVVVIANGVRAGRAKPLPLAPTGQPATAHVAAAPS